MSKEISREEFDKLIESYATKICSEIIKNGFEGVEMWLRLAMSETLDINLKPKRDERGSISIS